MGEIADMMLDGNLCEGCGEYLGDGDGYPRQYSACARPTEHQARVVKKRTMKCPECPRKFATHDAYLAHYRAKHDAAPKQEGI